MNSSSLKRHPGLRLFARDHGVGLICAHRLRKTTRAKREERIKLVEQMQSVCSEVLTLSLAEEQRVLAPLLARTGYAHRFFRHHQRIRDLIERLNKLEEAEDPGLGLLSMLGNALDDYVRWEENVLFPAIERMLNDEESAWLVEVTQHLEKSRCRPTQNLHASIAGVCRCGIEANKLDTGKEMRNWEPIESKRKVKTAVAV